MQRPFVLVQLEVRGVETKREKKRCQVPFWQDRQNAPANRYLTPFPRRYRVIDLSTIRRIAWYCIGQQNEVLPDPEVDAELEQRPAYQEGCLTDLPDLSIYDQRLEDKESEDDDDTQDE